jgi:hypothetical protein
MNIREQKAHDFADRWQGHGDEKQETQKFWMDLLQNVLDRPHALEETEFEHPTALGGSCASKSSRQVRTSNKSGNSILTNP